MLHRVDSLSQLLLLETFARSYIVSDAQNHWRPLTLLFRDNDIRMTSFADRGRIAHHCLNIAEGVAAIVDLRAEESMPRISDTQLLGTILTRILVTLSRFKSS
jgi:hypothetical protein